MAISASKYSDAQFDGHRPSVDTTVAPHAEPSAIPSHAQELEDEQRKHVAVELLVPLRIPLTSVCSASLQNGLTPPQAGSSLRPREHEQYHEAGSPPSPLRGITNAWVWAPSIADLQAKVPEPLTPMEMRVLYHTLRGHSAQAAARLMFRSPRTVEFHRNALMGKLECASRSELIERAIDQGWVHVELDDIERWEAECRGRKR